jgi:hypothetical protein
MKQAWGYLAVQQKRTEIKKAQMQQMADQANTERQMMSNQQAQEGKERLEQIKIIGNVIGEYAKAAFANPMNTQNPELILQRIQLELEKMYGNTGNANGEQPSAGGPPIPAGGAEQLAVQGGEGGGLPIGQPA